MSETKAAKAEREEAKDKLRQWIKPGDTVHTILRHVSRSGMLREIGIVLLKDGTDLHPNYLVAKALGERVGKRDGIVVGGCGMDMGFHIVYNLSHTLWPDGFGCIGKGCRSNDHSNGDRDYTPHNWVSPVVGLGGCVDPPRAHWHTDGGYALNHRWL
jgi:hypothetical protein